MHGLRNWSLEDQFEALGVGSYDDTLESQVRVEKLQPKTKLPQTLLPGEVLSVASKRLQLAGGKLISGLLQQDVAKHNCSNHTLQSPSEPVGNSGQRKGNGSMKGKEDNCSAVVKLKGEAVANGKNGCVFVALNTSSVPNDTWTDPQCSQAAGVVNSLNSSQEPAQEIGITLVLVSNSPQEQRLRREAMIAGTGRISLYRASSLVLITATWPCPKTGMTGP